MKMNSSPAYRSVVLECLRENASNMREEHQNLATRINIALAHSRANLLSVEKINQELKKMKVTVNEAILDIRGTKGTEYMKVVCGNILSNLINATVEFNMMRGSVPKNQITEADIRETILNVLGKDASIEEVSCEEEIDAGESTYNSEELSNFESECNDEYAAE
ncbi:uncharacterized protein [Drosophila kikkawai]|uniref:Uncharacterized protein n=1 Tax=Drosophila kikkawai TaxID=30033 RepID=A0A6P4I9V1_DROKI|nr:uncharacterized protein LOC108072748 [Drosophila kikkawai]